VKEHLRSLPIQLQQVNRFCFCPSVVIWKVPFCNLFCICRWSSFLYRVIILFQNPISCICGWFGHCRCLRGAELHIAVWTQFCQLLGCIIHFSFLLVVWLVLLVQRSSIVYIVYGVYEYIFRLSIETHAES